MAERILVAGISGYIAKHVAREFLEAGYSVRGTVRSKTQSQQVRETLRAFGADRLELVEADVLSDKGWAEAVSSCDGVAHLASPFPAAPPKNENDLIGPAVEGTLRVVRASAKAGCHTSSRPRRSRRPWPGTTLRKPGSMKTTGA